MAGSALDKRKDVVIEIGFKIDSMRNAMSKLKNDMNKQATDIKKQMADIRQMTDTQVKSMYGGDKKQILSSFKDELDSIGLAQRTATEKFNQRMVTSNKNLIKAKKNVHELNKVVKQPEFAGYALSLMFAGMAIKQVFDTIWQSSTKTFKEVMNSISDTTNGFSMMEGSLKYLQFTAGQALEPFAMWLIPIIDKTAEWISQNERLFATLTLTSGILGTILMVGGMAKLAWDGFVGTFIKLKGVAVTLGPVFKGIGISIGGITASVAWVLAVIAVAIIAAIAMWKTNFAGFRDYLKTIWENIKTAFLGYWDGIKDFLSGFWKIIKGLWSGDIDLIIEGVVQSFTGLYKQLKSIFQLTSVSLINIFIFMFNFLKSIVATAINSLVHTGAMGAKSIYGIIRKAAEASNERLGTSFDTSNIKAMEDEIDNLYNEFKISPTMTSYLNQDDLFGGRGEAPQTQTKSEVVMNFYGYDTPSISREMNRYIN